MSICRDHKIVALVLLKTMLGLSIVSYAEVPGSEGFEKNWSLIYSEAKAQIPIIYSDGGVCSGALVEKDRVLTAAHCIATLRDVFVFWPPDYDRPSKAQVVAMDRENDLALLALEKELSMSPLALNTEEEAIKVGEEIGTIGHPTSSRAMSFPPFDLDSTYFFSKGVVSVKGRNRFLSDISVSPGNSGGPALNRKGEIVGVVSKKRVDPGVGNITHIVDSKTVDGFIQGNKTKVFPLSVWKARNSWDLLIWHNTAFFEDANSLGHQNNIEGELALLFWDRLMISGSFALAGDFKRWPHGFVGWKWQSSTSRLQNWSLTSGLSQWKKEGSAIRTGFLVILDQPYLPFTFKYEFVGKDESFESIVSVGLRLF